MEIRASLLFFGLLAAGLIAGLACAAWMRAPLKRSALPPSEGQARFEQRRVQVCLVMRLLLYYAAALPVVVVKSGWAAVDPYLRGHLFDGFACAAFLTVAWSQLTRAQPALLRAADVRIAAAKFLLPLSSAVIAAAAAYVAGANWAAIGLVAFVAYPFAHMFWHAVVNATGKAAMAKQPEKADETGARG